MGKLMRIAKEDELKVGEMKEVSVEGRRILLARVGDSYYAADSRCPHFGGNLAKGKLEGVAVTCPLHGSQFDLTTGKVIRWTNFTGFASKLANSLKSPRNLVTYKVILDGDDVMIEV